jgi:hypothetical protein
MRVDRLLQTIPGDALRGPGARVAARGLLWHPSIGGPAMEPR